MSGSASGSTRMNVPSTRSTLADVRGLHAHGSGRGPGSRRSGSGSGSGGHASPNLAGRGTCGHLTPVQLSDCPRSPAIRLPNCDQAGLGELCEGDGECDTGNHLNNCPSYTTWYGCMSQGATLTYMICRTYSTCDGGPDELYLRDPVPILASLCTIKSPPMLACCPQHDE